MIYFFFLLSIAIENEHVFDEQDIDIEAKLQMNDTPAFQKLPTDDGIFNVASRSNTDISMSSTTISNSGRNSRNYFTSYIQFSSSTVQGCWAFGAGLEFGSGGAFYLQDTTFYSKSSNFLTNKASIGGSLSSVGSLIYITGAKFDANYAYKIAGIFFEHQCESAIHSSVFINSFCYEICGGAFVSESRADFQKCNFTNNTAGHSAGALYISNSEAYFYTTLMSYNKCGSNLTSLLDSNTNREYRFMRKKLFRVKGGGGMIVVGVSTTKAFRIVTYKSCFLNNTVENGQKDLFFDVDNSIGLDILFAGGINW